MAEYALFLVKALEARPSWVEPTIRGLETREQAERVAERLPGYRIGHLAFGHWVLDERSTDD